MESASKIEKVVGFYSEAGGGHKAGLNALLQELLIIQPDLYTQGYDFTSKDEKGYGPISEKSYTNLTENFEPIWRLFCWSITSKLAIKALNDGVDLIYGKNIENIVKKEQLGMQNPNAILILCTYYFVADIIARRFPDISRENIQVLVTDNFGPQNVWFGSCRSNYIVFSEEANQKALAFGVADSNILYDGPVFNSRFNEKCSEESNKEFAFSKGLNLDLPIVEIISGGASLPKGFEVFKEALAGLESSEIVLICGRNAKLIQNAKNLLNKYPHLQMFVKVEGFSKEVYEWMNIATIIISKAGPGIMQEAWALQKPFFACNYIWPQEQLNFDLISQKGVGIANKNPENLVADVIECLNNPSMLDVFNAKLKELNYKSNINQVAKDLLLLS
jgi:Glycosyltransferase family 28 C-terminal domain